MRVGEWYYRVQKDFGMECETEVMHENSDEKRLGVRNGYGTWKDYESGWRTKKTPNVYCVRETMELSIVNPIALLISVEI